MKQRFLRVLSIRSLRGRLALLVLLAACPALALVAGLTKRAYDQERAAVSRHLLNTTRAVAVLTERKFDAAESLLRAFASLPSLEQRDLTTFHAEARKVVDNQDEWIVLLAPTGQQLVNTRVPVGADLPLVKLEDEFWATVRRGQRYVSNVVTGPVVGTPVFGVTIPVMRGDELLYMVVYAMQPAALSRTLAAQQIAPDGVVVVIDRHGIIATRSRSPERFVGRHATPDLVTAAKAQSGGVIQSVTLEGIPTLSAFTPCGSTGWTAAIGAPRAEIYASAERLLRLAAIWTAVLLAVTAAGAAWIGRSVVRGMDALVEETRRIGSGTAASLGLTGLTEIDVVGSALRSTAEQLSARERELRALNHSLEERVETRTTQLAAANTALISANRDLEDFARIASHDLREPLRSMTAFSELLRSDHASQLDETGSDYLRRIEKSSRRMEQLLEAILAYSQASTKPLPEFKPVDLSVVLDEVQQDVSRRVRDTGGEVVGEKLAWVRGDQRLLHQMLLNLVSNALKFRRAEVPPVVKVTCSTAAGKVTLSVTDNGIGFDPAAAERIFAPFERLERSFEGSGMGLAIVRRIVERHGGTVTATSEAGRGSCFHVTLDAASPGR